MGLAARYAISKYNCSTGTAWDPKASIRGKPGFRSHRRRELQPEPRAASRRSRRQIYLTFFLPGTLEATANTRDRGYDLGSAAKCWADRGEGVQPASEGRKKLHCPSLDAHGIL